MAVHYEVPEGKSLLIEGPANIIVKTGTIPVIDVPPEPAPEADSKKRKSNDK